MPPVTSLLSVVTAGQQIPQGFYSASMRPTIVGPMAKLIRYVQPAEKLLGQLDTQYTAASDTTYSIPSFQSNSIFDAAYTSLGVTFENAYLLYATKLIGSGNPSCTITPVSGFDNQIQTNNTNLVFTDTVGSLGHTTPFLGDRGIKIGDVVHLYATISSAFTELYATVTGFVNTVVAASIGAAAAGSGNKITSSAGTVVSKSGPNNHIAMTADATVWDPTINGGTTTTDTDTYTITVAVAGAGGNGGALINVTSANGDNKTGVPVATFGTVTVATERGLKLTFSDNGALPVDPGVSPDVLVTTDGLGNPNPQIWTVVVTGGLTAAVATSAGTYTGTEIGQTPTYTLAVTRGGTMPQSLQTPPTVQATGVNGGSGHTLQAGNYLVAYTWVNASGETTVGSSESASITVNSGEQVVVTAPALPVGVISWNLYSTVAGGGTGTEHLYASGIQTLTYTMTAATVGGTPVEPVSNTCVVNHVQTPPIEVPVINVTGGGSVGGSLQAGAYYCLYTYKNATGETTVSPESAQFTVGAGNIPKLYLPVLPPSATAINIYLTAAAGGTTTETLYQANVVTTVAQPYALLSIAQASGAAQPTANTMQLIPGNVCPLMSVMRSDGVDGAVNVQYLRTGVAVPVGALGVTVSFSHTQLIKGDKYTIQVTTKTNGPVQTLVLNRGLSTAGLSGATDLNVEFYIVASSIGVPANNQVSPYNNNWTVNAAAPNVIIRHGIQLFDPLHSWTIGGVLTPLTVKKISGSFLSYRQWLIPISGVPTVGILTNPLNIASTVGVIDPDNPLGQACSLAMLPTPLSQNVITTNSSCNNIVYVQLAGDPTLPATWQAALDSTSNDGATAYSYVPLSVDPNVHALFAANVNTEAASSMGNYKVTYAPAIVTSFTPKVTQTVNGGVLVTATLKQDPNVVTTLYDYVQAQTGQGLFITRGVLPGDQVRIQFGSDPYGNVTYNTYTVASIVSEDSLILTSGSVTGLPENSAIKVEVWHPASTTDVLNQVSAQAASYGNRRVRVVWPDVVTINTTTAYPSYYLAAALAGMGGAVAPQQGLTKVEIQGFGVNPRQNFFTNAQFAVLNAAGVATCRQQTLQEGALWYCQKFLTTAANGNAADTEEEAVRVQDAIAYAYINSWAPLYGASNITNATLAQLTNDFKSITNALKQTSIGNIGAVLVDATLDYISPHPVLKTRVQVGITVSFNYPLNKAELTLSI